MMHNRIKLLFGIAVVVSAGIAAAAPAWAQAVDKSNFYRANLYYEEGKYDDALALYLEIPDKGYESADVYYNIGNCFYKKGDFARALLFYERGRRLAPGDADLSSNYNLASGQVTQSYRVPEKRIFDKVIAGLYASFSSDGLAVVIFLLNILAFIFLSTRLLCPAAVKKSFFYLSFACFVFCGLGVYDLFTRSQFLDKEALIVSEKADVMFEPSESAVTHFTIYGGEKVILVEDKSRWLKVKRLDGKLGWIQRSDLEII